jgi:hypothetical protein
MRTMHSETRPLRLGSLLLPALGILFFAGCGARTAYDVPPSQRLLTEVRSVLGPSQASAEYQRDRNRLKQMGPEIDVVLVGLVGDTRARTEARADALLLLADRRSPLALPTLESALQNSNDRLRSAAVLGLNRLAATSPDAVILIRRATSDPSRVVRLNALQSLDVREVETIRQVLTWERDTEVRQVGLQLIALAEARGAPLSKDRRGALRTAAVDDEAQIVFRPVSVDSVAKVAYGDLRLELPTAPDIPLAASAIAIGNVVPAFFSPERSSVVVEAEGQIRVIDVSTRGIRNLGPGIAPRPIPFTPHFVFLRERRDDHGAAPDELTYDVFRAPFRGGGAERIGELRARTSPDVHAGESPVRWMVIDEGADGFVLKGENLETFPLPVPAWAPASGNGNRR